MLTKANPGDDATETDALAVDDAVAEVEAATRRPKRDYNYFADMRRALAELKTAEDRQ